MRLSIPATRPAYFKKQSRSTRRFASPRSELRSATGVSVEIEFEKATDSLYGMAGEQMNNKIRETEEEKRVSRELHEINIKIRKLESEIERLQKELLAAKEEGRSKEYKLGRLRQGASF